MQRLKGWGVKWCSRWLLSKHSTLPNRNRCCKTQEVSCGPERHPWLAGEDGSEGRLRRITWSNQSLSRIKPCDPRIRVITFYELQQNWYNKQSFYGLINTQHHLKIQDIYQKNICINLRVSFGLSANVEEAGLLTHLATIQQVGIFKSTLCVL